MSHEHDDTPPEHGTAEAKMLDHLVSLSARVGGLSEQMRLEAERHDRHITGLRSEVREYAEDVRAVLPRVEDHTGRIKRLEGAASKTSGTQREWVGFFKGMMMTAAIVGGAIAALAALGVFK